MTNATIFLALTTSSFPPTPLHPRLPVCKLRCCSTRKVHKHPSQFGTSTTRTGHQVSGKYSSEEKTNAIDVIKEKQFSSSLVASTKSTHQHTDWHIHPYLPILKTICISGKSLPGSSIKIFLSRGLPNRQIAWFQEHLRNL